jgi:hypothetical protein
VRHRGDERIGPVALWSPSGTRPVLTIAGAWLVGAWLAGAAGWVAALRPPAPQLILVGLTAAVLAAATLAAPFRRFVESVDLRALVLFHLTRFVGVYFLVLHARGELPWAFAVTGGWGDITVAASALLLVLRARPGWPPRVRRMECPRTPGHPRGGADREPPRSRGPEPMRALLRLPLSLLPTFVVPIVIATHVLMLRRLARAAPARSRGRDRDRLAVMLRNRV